MIRACWAYFYLAETTRIRPGVLAELVFRRNHGDPMNGPFKAWFGQVTTGIGALIGTPVIIALLTHQITPEQALPGIVAALVGLLWPENKGLAQSAQTAAADLETLLPQLLTAYRTGLQHGAAAGNAPSPAGPAAATVKVAAAVLLALLLGGLAPRAAFASGVLPQLTPAQIVTDAGNADTALLNALNQPAVAALVPPATLAVLKNDLALGQQAAQALSSNLPAAAAATTIQTINLYLNAVLNTLAAPPINGLLPPPANTIEAAAALVMPELETFVDTYILPASLTPGAAGARVALIDARARLAAQAPAVTTIVQARAVLAQYAVAAGN